MNDILDKTIRAIGPRDYAVRLGIASTAIALVFLKYWRMGVPMPGPWGMAWTIANRLLFPYAAHISDRALAVPPKEPPRGISALTAELYNEFDAIRNPIFRPIWRFAIMVPVWAFAVLFVACGLLFALGEAPREDSGSA